MTANSPSNTGHCGAADAGRGPAESAPGVKRASVASPADELAALRADLRRAGHVLGAIAVRHFARWAPELARPRGVAFDLALRCAPGAALSAAGAFHAGASGAGGSFNVARAASADPSPGLTFTLRARPLSPAEAQHA